MTEREMGRALDEMRERVAAREAEPPAIDPREAPRIVERAERRITDAQRAALATEWNVSPLALANLRVGIVEGDELRALRCDGAAWASERPTRAFVFAEHDRNRRIIGVTLVSPRGVESAPAGWPRGVLWPLNTDDQPGPVWIVRGVSNVAAAVAMRRAAVGWPPAGSEAHLAEILRPRTLKIDGICEPDDLIVVAERDERGAPARTAEAESIARELASRLRVPIQVALPGLTNTDT